MAEKSPEKTPELATRVVTRRAEIRFDVLGQVEVHSVWRLRPLMLRELSVGGFSLESTSPFEVGAAYKFRVGIEGQRKSMIVQAKAAHCSLASVTAQMPIYIVGFQLIEPTDTVRKEMAALVRFVESFWRDEEA